MFVAITAVSLAGGFFLLAFGTFLFRQWNAPSYEEHCQLQSFLVPKSATDYGFGNLDHTPYPVVKRYRDASYSPTRIKL